ncbi:hypothetical protein ACHQM5_030728 [Ranunculus cassubicifolius]
MGKELVTVSAPGLGPWGGAGGRPFDDGVFTGIRSILVRRDDDAVRAIIIEYDRSGQSVVMRHGSEIGHNVNRVCLDYPKECLISVSGFYGPFHGQDVIKSLSFQTTKGKYGPFGEELGIFFSSTEVNAKIVGFHGRSGACLDAIGVVREYFKCSK